MRRPSRQAAALLVAFVGAVAEGQSVPVAVVELPAEPVQIRLDRCDVTVRQVPDGTAVLRELVAEESLAPAVEVARTSGGVSVLRRSNSERRVHLELELPTLGGVEIAGHDLHVEVLAVVGEIVEPSAEQAFEREVEDVASIADPVEREQALERMRLEEAARRRAEESRVFGNPLRPPSLRQEATQPALMITADTSTVLVSGIATPLEISASDSSVELERCDGGVVLHLNRSFASARSLTGSCELELEATELSVEGVGPDVTGWARGGWVRIVGLDGTLQGEFADARVDLEDGSVIGTISCVGGALSVRRSEVRRLELASTEAVVQLERVQGAVEVELIGGRLEGSGLEGKLTVAANNGDVDVRDVDSGAVNLDLSNGARGRLQRVHRAVAVTVEDGELTLDGGGLLALSAVRSDVAVTGLERLTRFSAVDSEVRLDLTGVRGSVALQFAGDSRSRVDVSTPCQVRLSDGAGVDPGAVEVVGCELAMGVRRRRMPARGVGGEAPVVVSVTADETSDVEIHGRP